MPRSGAARDLRLHARRRVVDETLRVVRGLFEQGTLRGATRPIADVRDLDSLLLLAESELLDAERREP